MRDILVELVRVTPELPYPITEDDILKGQVEPPNEFLEFFNVLYTGKSASPTNPGLQRLVRSACDDIMYVGSRGKLKPRKQLLWGIAVKTLTGSKRMLTLCNRYGHAISYGQETTIETEAAEAILARELAVPDGMMAEKGLSTATAWDNYNERRETLNGAGIYDDTVGIIYQNRPTSVSDPQNNTTPLEPNDKSAMPLQTRSSKRLKSRRDEIAPYRKTPKVTRFNYMSKPTVPESLSRVTFTDTLWMTCCEYTNTPMWSGWNSVFSDDPLPNQQLGFMKNLGAPSTQLSSVAETMNISMQVARECGDDYGIVSYDMGLAKPALRIQDTEHPKYEDLFILPGPFHALTAFYGSVGYIKNGSGALHILVISGILAPGCVNGFVSGKHYNRCRRVNALWSCSTKILHFRQFTKTVATEELEHYREEMYSMTTQGTKEALEQTQASPAVQKIISDYEAYTEATLVGDHGKTAQFWLQDALRYDVARRLERGIRENDVALMTYSYWQMVAVFFSTGRPIYKRWLTKCALQLANVDATHPGLRQTLENGALSVQLSQRPFCRLPPDQGLEMTVNKTSASRLQGVAAFTNNDETVQRYMITHFFRMFVVQSLLDEADINKSEEGAKELRPSRIKRDNANLVKLTDTIQSTMNPFDNEGDPALLYNVSTGKPLPASVTTDLLRLDEIGQERRDEFVAQCQADPARFELSIPNARVKNFTATTKKVKLTRADKRVVELVGSRNLLGRLLYLANKSKLDLANVFQYPLTPIPLSMGNIDGAKGKSGKSKLMPKIENGHKSDIPIRVDVGIYDAMFLIRRLINYDCTYGDLAKTLLKTICTSSANYILFDRYDEPSIKASERNDRRDTHGTDEFSPNDLQISGPYQKRPRNFQGALTSSEYKTRLIDFLVHEWRKDEYARIIGDRRVFVAYSKRCDLLTSESDEVVHVEIPDLAFEHEEADTLIFFMLQHIQNHTSAENVVVRANDTDILVLAMYHISHQLKDIHVWLDFGLDSNNTRRYIHINELVNDQPTDYWDALLGYHAFTGSDYTSSFRQKGKVRLLSKLHSDRNFKSALMELGSDQFVIGDSLTKFEAVVCAMYACPKMKSVNNAAYQKFMEKYKPTDPTRPLENIKGADPTYYPPCQSVLRSHISRCHLVVKMWKNAISSVPNILDPLEYGWIRVEGDYAIEWFQGRQLPQSLVDVIPTPNEIPSGSADEEPDDDDIDADSGDDEAEDADDADDDYVDIFEDLCGEYIL